MDEFLKLNQGVIEPYLERMYENFEVTSYDFKNGKPSIILDENGYAHRRLCWLKWWRRVPRNRNANIKAFNWKGTDKIRKGYFYDKQNSIFSIPYAFS